MHRLNENSILSFIVKSPTSEFKIIAGCWQVIEVSVKDDNTKSVIICKEATKGIFLPVFVQNEQIYFDTEDTESSSFWKFADTTIFKYTEIL